MAAGTADAVILAGGRARRAGGVDKPGLLVGSRSLAASVLAAAVTAGAARVVLVGPPRPDLVAARPGPPGGVRVVRENPPGQGPVPALRCGLAEVPAPVVLVLAADLPFLRARHLAPLLAEVRGGRAGAVLADDTGQAQWLAGCWRSGALREALTGYRGRSLHGLLGPLAPAVIGYDRAPGEPPPWLDCDSEQDLAQARGWLAAGGEEREAGR